MSFPHNLTLPNMAERVTRANAKLVGNPFTIKVQGPYTIFGYNYAHPALFSDPIDGPYLRECRGLIFNTESGLVVSRPYHKFFNIGEYPAIAMDQLPFNEPHVILEKLDGSMVRPVLDESGNLVFATRAGMTEVSQQVDNWITLGGLIDFCLECVQDGITPIFEWCSRRQRIVIDHPKDRLVLTGMRNNATGYYYSRYVMEAAGFANGFEVVQPYTLDIAKDKSAFLAHVKGLENMEGFVVRWDTGEMVKVKADAYLRLHHTLDIMRNENTVIGCYLDNLIDDVLPRLSDADKTRLLDYWEELDRAIGYHAMQLSEAFLSAIQGNPTKKEYAVNFAAKHPDSATLFSMWGKETAPYGVALESLKGRIRKALDTGKLESVRYVFEGVNWNE